MSTDMEYADDSASAANKVYNTVELLENVLGFLDMKNIWRLHRVNMYTRDVIKNSKKLRRIIWLEPVITRKGLTWEYNKKGQLEPRIVEGISVSDRKVKLLARLNPVFDLWKWGSSKYERTDVPILAGIAGLHLDMTALLRCSGVEWRSMFVTQPPTDVVEIFIVEGNIHSKSEVEFPGGVTTGDVRDHLDMTLRTWSDECSVYMHVPNVVVQSSHSDSALTMSNQFRDWNLLRWEASHYAYLRDQGLLGDLKIDLD